MVISGVNAPKPRVASSTFVVFTVTVPFEGVVLLDVRTLGFDELLPATVAVVGMMLALWRFDDG